MKLELSLSLLSGTRRVTWSAWALEGNVSWTIKPVRLLLARGSKLYLAAADVMAVLQKTFERITNYFPNFHFKMLIYFQINPFYSF